jgi:hypothetical protein
MKSQNPEVAVRVAKEVKNGLLPPAACVGCGGTRVELRENWAICQRADTRWEDSGERQAVFGLVGWIPFFIPLPSKNPVEIREGIDIVCPLPIRVCEQCWDVIDGGARHRLLSCFSQFFFIAAFVAFMTWMFSRRRGWEISYLWAVASLAAAVPFHIGASFIEAKRPRRLRKLLYKVDSYKELLDEFPNADLREQKPTALAVEGLQSNDL